MAKMDLKTRYELYARLLPTGKGRNILASTMSNPLRKRRDYESVGRKLFKVEQLPDGATASYDKDPNIAAYMVAEEGESISSVVRSVRVTVPTFEIASLPEVQISEVQARRFNVVDRALALGKAQIKAEEDSRIFATMDAVATDPINPHPDMGVSGAMTPAALADAFATIEENDIRVAFVVMNSRDYTDFRKWTRDVLDPVTQASLLNVGILARVWGAYILTSRMVTPGTIYVCGEPEFLGVMPVRQDLAVLPADSTKQRRLGWSMWENLGILCHNPYALQRLVKA